MKTPECNFKSLKFYNTFQKSEEVVSSEPDTKDADVWTHEPQYEQFLHVRVFKPEGLDQKQICCKLSYGKQRHTTPILDFYPAVS